MAQTTVDPRRDPTNPEPNNDYQLDRDGERAGPPFSFRLARLLQGIVLIILIAASAGLFWVIGSLLHLI